MKPRIIASPKMPNRFWIDSGSACHLLKPGIRSNTQFIGAAKAM